MAEEWDRFRAKLMEMNTPQVAVQKVNINDENNRDLMEQFTVQSVPHIVRISDAGDTVVYDGNRTADDLLKWCTPWW